MSKNEFLSLMDNRTCFGRYDLLDAMRTGGFTQSDATFKAIFQKLLNEGSIIRVGRNAYCVASPDVSTYSYVYTQLAVDVANSIKDNHPYLNFSIFEMVQMNEFVNHQIAHNIIFVPVESDIGDFVFDTLKGKYPGKVLINPTTEIFHRYWYDNMVVIERLITEAPMGNSEHWHTGLEKMLVDIVADQLIKESFSETEYPNIFKGAFERYAIDESRLFRYAKRRGAEKKIRAIITEQTDVQLRVS